MKIATELVGGVDAEISAALSEKLFSRATHLYILEKKEERDDEQHTVCAGHFHANGTRYHAGGYLMRNNSLSRTPGTDRRQNRLTKDRLSYLTCKQRFRLEKPFAIP